MLQVKRVANFTKDLANTGAALREKINVCHPPMECVCDKFRLFLWLPGSCNIKSDLILRSASEMHQYIGVLNWLAKHRFFAHVDFNLGSLIASSDDCVMV